MNKTTEKRCRIHNWRQYNQSLIQRGSVTTWFAPEVLEGWLNQHKSGKPGASDHYSDAAIEMIVTIKIVFRLGYRQAAGFVASIFAAMEIDLQVPHYSTVCRRSKELNVALPTAEPEEAHILIDSTGAEVFGQGQWHVRQHGASKRRTWRKVHFAVDAENRQIVASIMTTNSLGDSQILPELLEQIPGEIRQVSADGAYDTLGCHEAIAARGAQAAIPPRRTARIRRHGNSRGPKLPRDEVIRAVRRHGRAAWKVLVGYHQRSLVETTVMRFKVIFGPRLYSRLFQSEVTETRLKCKILNRMASLGLPGYVEQPP